MVTFRCSRVASACALAVLAVTVVASPARTVQLVEPKVTERLFPQGVFCPFPFDIPFTADGPDITLRISTSTVNYFDTNSNDVQWTHQQLDNICVVTETDYLAHHGSLGTYAGDCYIGAPVAETLYFQDAGTILLKELFPDNGGDPASRGWDLSHGCSWNTGASQTGPNDPGTETNFTPVGCLDLGQFNAALALDDSAYTSKTVTGLTANGNYRLTGWWNVNQMQPDKINLTVRIYGSDKPTPIVVRTWGALKRQYR